MKKKASLNLSINAIVVLILAITMLGLGLTFMRNIFGGAAKEFTKVSGEVEKQMIDQMKQSSKVVTLSRPKVELKIGESDQIFLGLKNVEQGNVPFKILAPDAATNPTTCQSIGAVQCGYINEGWQDLSIETVFYDENAQTGILNIASGEVTVLPINIEANTQAEPGTCYCTIVVDVNNEIEKIELTIDVEV